MKILSSALFASALALFAAAPALADTASFTLNTVNPTLTVGSTVTFNGTITAPLSNNGTVFLLGDTFTVNGPFTLDDTDFYSDTPTNLDPGHSYSGALFTLTLPASAAAGVYGGSFQIDFADTNLNSFSENANFQATVAGTTPVAATPEPGTWLLLSTGLGTVAVLRRRLQPTA